MTEHATEVLTNLCRNLRSWFISENSWGNASSWVNIKESYFGIDLWFENCWRSHILQIMWEENFRIPFWKTLFYCSRIDWNCEFWFKYFDFHILFFSDDNSDQDITCEKEKDVLRQAVSILSEYISEPYITKLKEVYKCEGQALSAEQKRQFQSANAPLLYNSKVSSSKSEHMKTPTKTKESSKAKALHDTKDKLRLKPITSFFSPAPPKKS